MAVQKPLPPKVIAPKQISETKSPVFAKLLYFIVLKSPQTPEGGLILWFNIQGLVSKDS